MNMRAQAVDSAEWGSGGDPIPVRTYARHTIVEPDSRYAMDEHDERL